MRSSLLVAFATVVASLPCQTVWRVNPGTDLGTVFAAAAPGDIVVLGAGRYAPFRLTKGLTVIGPATIQGTVNPPSPFFDTTVTVPAGQQARLVGLDFPPTFPPIPATMWGQMVTARGDVSFEDCQLGNGSPHSLLVESGNVVLQRCVVRGGPSLGGGFRQTGGFCSIADSRIEGLFAGELDFGTPIWARPAIDIVAGTLLIASSTLVGGNAWRESSRGAFLPPSPALACSGTGSVSLADSSATGGSGFYFGAPLGPGAAAITSTAAVRDARSTVTGGPGTFQGPPTVGNVTADPELVGIRLDRGFAIGQTSTATATAGTTGGVLALLATLDTTVVNSPFAVEPVFGLLTQAFTLAITMPAPGATVPAAVTVPNDPTLLGVALWIQAAQSSGGPFRLSPVVGGVIR